ncbi:DUF2339 domain-containing protein [Flavihumibacter sp. RY-1]|uniref:DUF2339 domain-containing protein n=1 Tax=Flavihumibacter fluminis TaxID=2909236 RepID=A0ABS9BGB2_9BACT|nr:DUF2339 domain-containing protein [Flavihumibacter fluminis]MCF1714635.1 DUF2339 domain-containing protein [Flavihumibacter fluminis]
MSDNSEQINQLLSKLELLLRRHEEFAKEIYNLRYQIQQLKEEKPFVGAAKSTVPEIKESSQPTTTTAPAQKIIEPYRPPTPTIVKPKEKSDWEKFIGENLINKIGIVITVIGVAIGAKYAIDKELISPLTRIILGYLVGLGLLGFSIKLKPKYESFSAVLLSGAMAVMYFITYTAYSLYELFPQWFAFLLMLLFTVFTVVASLHYNRQVIALIGLVGAYAVPFLLSEGSGKVGILFSYMAIINLGILSIAVKKYWKPLYYAAFGFTWIIYASWFSFFYVQDQHFALALLFLAINFILFYLTFLAYKLLQNQQFVVSDVLMLVLNSFLFYGLGYAILADHPTGKHLLGLFTLGNAIIHFVVSAVIHRKQLADRTIFYMVSGLVLVFITIAIPVQLDGNWVTLVWAGEAALLFWIGRTRQVPVYEKISYVLMLLAFLSMIQDWSVFNYSYFKNNPDSRFLPVFNIHFLTYFLFLASFGFINFLHHKKLYKPAFESQKEIASVITYFIPAIFLLIMYLGIRMEISNYWMQRYVDSAVEIKTGNEAYPNYYWNTDLIQFKNLWVTIYTLAFVSILAFVNFRYFKNRNFGYVNLVILLLAIAIYLTQGLYDLSELREAYLNQTLSDYFKRGSFNITIRYISFAFVALALFTCYKYIKQDFMKLDMKPAFDFLLHVSILWIASSELINWMDIAHSTQSYKLGLSILWGLYALFLIALGIWKKNKPLRIGAIALFGITLIKLFTYDIAHLDTIAKTIVFVSLGVLLLLISFLYNKYKHIITDELEN